MTRPPKGARGGGRKGSSKRARASGRAGRRAASGSSEGAATGSAGGRPIDDARDQDGEVGVFVRGLTETERVALIVRDELFGGSWESYQKDLEARAAGRPYVFKLASRIEDDLKAVEKLRGFERRHEVDLADYLGEGR